jgi:thioester reductase-like protein
VIREEDMPAIPTSDGHRSPDGYAQSKWVAERLVMMARSRGLPVSIYRPGRITGHSQTGVSSLSDFSFRFIKGCIQIGSVPDWDGEVNLITVDYVSEALAYLSLNADSLGKVFHFSHSQPARWKDMIDWIRSYGYTIQQVPYAEWRQRIEHSPDNVLYSLLPTLPEAGFENEMAISEVSAERKVEFDCRNTIDGLADSSINCAPINSELINRYLSYLVDAGFLNAPVARLKSGAS